MVHQNLLSWRCLFVFQLFGYFLSKKKQIKMCRTLITINNLPLKILINCFMSYKLLLYFAVVVSKNNQQFITVRQNLLTWRCLFVFQLFGYFLSWNKLKYWSIIASAIWLYYVKSPLLQSVKLFWHDDICLSFNFLVTFYLKRIKPKYVGQW